MKKVICVVEFNDQLEVGKIYTAGASQIKTNFLPTVFIQNLDGSHVGFYPKEYFMDLEEWREKQINEILDENKNIIF
jgi:hypothetical protein